MLTFLPLAFRLFDFGDGIDPQKCANKNDYFYENRNRAICVRWSHVIYKRRRQKRVVDCKKDVVVSSSLHYYYDDKLPLFNSKPTFQEGTAIIFFLCTCIWVFCLHIYESRMSSFISRQAVKTGKSLLLQQRRRNSSGSTADNGKFHCMLKTIPN